MPERTDTAAGDRAGTATQVFVDHRELLFAIDHNMLGRVTDTEDARQDTSLSWTGRTGRSRSDGIDNPVLEYAHTEIVDVLDQPAHAPREERAMAEEERA
ncbi:hypothetical protein ACWD5V_28405 [Streptomyces sp. NPDC002523]